MTAIVYMICGYGEHGPENSQCTLDRNEIAWGSFQPLVMEAK